MEIIVVKSDSGKKSRGHRTSKTAKSRQSYSNGHLPYHYSIYYLARALVYEVACKFACAVMMYCYMASSVGGLDDPNRAMWLATWAGKMEPSCPLGTTCCIPHSLFQALGQWGRSKKRAGDKRDQRRAGSGTSPFPPPDPANRPTAFSIVRTDREPGTGYIPQEKFTRKPYNKSFIDQVCSVKMAGYWPRSFFASLWTLTSSRSINMQKKNLANIQPSWPHTWSITHTYLSCHSDKCWVKIP